MLKLPLVSGFRLSTYLPRYANNHAAKFTGYQYGGRPLGLTFVKYTNANGGDAMEAEGTGMTQDQMM
jgi:hypothetical protein